MSSLLALDSPNVTATDLHHRLLAEVRSLGSVVVGFSGGIDSTLLAAAAHECLGERALMVIADSPSYPRAELALARELAEERGWAHRVIHTDEMANAEYRRNDGNRCYHCKAELFDHLNRIASNEGYAAIAYGANVDDMSDHRPGHRAANERRVCSPLYAAGLTKADIRRLARDIGLPNWSKPSMACLSSRIPYGTPVTTETLARIEQAEAVLRRLGFEQYRVRHHDTVARIELPRSDFQRVLDEGLARELSEGVRAAGYTFVCLDLAGFRSGSLNQLLPGEAS